MLHHILLPAPMELFCYCGYNRVMRKIKNPYIRNIEIACAIIIGGFILFSLAFLLDFFVQSIIRIPLKMFTHENMNESIFWVPHFLHWSFVIVIAALSWLVYRSKLPDLAKAIYTNVPLGTILLTIWIELYQSPNIAYLAEITTIVLVLFYLLKTKKPWPYFFTVFFVAFSILMIGVFNIEI